MYSRGLGIPGHLMMMKTTLLALLLSQATATTFAQAWTLTSAAITNWSCVASSADGSKLVAAVDGGFIYSSANSGLTWAQTSSSTNSWTSLASSEDGTHMYAANMSYSDSSILHSTNFGATWQKTGSGQDYWLSIACSADGGKVAATYPGYSVFVSTNFGIDWTQLVPQPTPADDLFRLVSSSADGNTLAVISQGWGPEILTTPASIQEAGHQIVFFDNGGLCTSIAISADGTRISASINSTPQPASTNWGGMLYTEANSGAFATTNFTTVSNWTSIASSADGSRLVAVSSGGVIYTSVDAGATWGSAHAPNAPWSGVASSADGCKLVAVANSGGIYTWQTTPMPALKITPSADGLLVSWIVPSMNLQLQENSDLTTTNWADVAIAPVLNVTNLQNQIALPQAGAMRFYRLQAMAN